MRWPLRNWPTGPLPPDDDLYEEEVGPTCPPQKHEVQSAEEEAMAIQEEIDELQKMWTSYMKLPAEDVPKVLQEFAA